MDHQRKAFRERDPFARWMDVCLAEVTKRGVYAMEAVGEVGRRVAAF